MPKLELKKRPKQVTLIEGFPGFGLVGTIVTEFLIEHLDVEPIGRILFEDSPAMVAIHENKLVEPMGIFYNEKYNIVILHSLNSTPGTEWKIADIVVELAKELEVKEIISIEGVGSSAQTDSTRTFYFSNNTEKAQKFKEMHIDPLQEGIIMGVTSALLLKAGQIPMSCVFAETNTKMPDSKAAAKVVEILDKYLNLEVDPQPLIETAEKFEKKLRSMLNSGAEAAKLKDAKQMSYVG